MQEKINTFFDSLPEKKYLFLSFLFCFLGDLAIAAYLWLKFNNFELFQNMFHQVLLAQGVALDQVPSEFYLDQFRLMLGSLKLMLILIVLIHFITYIFMVLKKRGAIAYVRVMLYVAIPGAFLLFLSAVGSAPLMGFYFLIQTGLYLFVILGMKKFLPLPISQNKAQ